MSRFFRRISLLLSLALLICIPISFFFTAGLVRFNQQSSEILIVATGAMSFSDQRGAGLAAIYAKDQTTPGHWMGGIDRWPPSGRIYWKYVLLPGYYKLTPVVSTSGSLAQPSHARSIPSIFTVAIGLGGRASAVGCR